MSGINKVILVGNLGRDPEVRTIEGGAKVANFSLATTESYRNKDGNRVDQTEWHRIVLWRGLAEVAEKYLRKGNSVYVEGRIASRKYTDKDGVERTITEIVGSNMTMLGGARRDDAGGYSSQPDDNNIDSAAEPQAEDVNDDLPF